MKRNVVKTLGFGILVLVFAISFVSPSEAASKVTLKGTYAVSGLDVCVGHWVVNPSGGGSTYWTKTATLQGTATFNVDGTGAGEIDQVSMVHPIYTPIPLGPYYNPAGGWPADPSLLPLGSTSTTNGSFTFTYSIDPVTREITQVTSSSGQVTSGSLNGKYFTSDTYTSIGHVSLDKKTIIGSTIPLSATPDQSDFTRTVSFWNDADHTDLYGSQEEICQRHRVSTQIGKK